MPTLPALPIPGFGQSPASDTLSAGGEQIQALAESNAQENVGLQIRNLKFQQDLKRIEFHKALADAVIQRLNP